VTAGKNPRRMAVGDFNRDGKLDLAVACVDEGLSVLLGTGGGFLGTHTIFSTSGAPWAVAVGDVDGDGNPDLAVTNFNGRPGSVSILLGSASGSFGPPTPLLVGDRPTSVALSDFNGDGLLDLAVANEDGNTVSVFLNHGPMATLTVNRQGSGTGTIISNPAGITCGATCAMSYPVGTSVTLTPQAPGGSFFLGWSGAGCTGVDPCVVAMNVAKAVTATFSATTFTFTDETLTPQQTVIKAAHVLELRAAINRLRASHGLSTFAFSDPTLIAGATGIGASHILELRTALDAVYLALGKALPTYTDPTIVPRQTAIKRLHLLEIRMAVRAVE